MTETPIAQSPLPESHIKKIIDGEVAIPKGETMTFDKAIAEVIKGNKIHKLEWKDLQYWGELRDGMLQLHKPDGAYYVWTLNDGDLQGSDWVTI